jgi:hypothetical protein
MKPPDERHYTEEELLMHLLGEEVTEMGSAVSRHLSRCGQCMGVFQEYRELYQSILRWQVPEISEEAWLARKDVLMDHFRKEQLRSGSGVFPFLTRVVRRAWGYAVENPLPTLGYVIVAVAFASERTITIFRLDRILPGTNEVLAILRQML